MIAPGLTYDDAGALVEGFDLLSRSESGVILVKREPDGLRMAVWSYPDTLGGDHVVFVSDVLS